MTYSEKIEQIKLYIIQVHTVLPDALKKNAGNSLFLMAIAFAFVPKIAVAESTYPLIDTMQDRCFNASGTEIDCPDRDENFFGQDAQYTTTQFSYKDNGNDTVTDLNTDLVWQKTPDFARRYLYGEAEAYCDALTLGGRRDWRLPTIKELYSLADFRGELLAGDTANSTPYINTDFFDFQYREGREAFAGQYWSSTLYVKGPVIDEYTQGAFGFNFADGHIKAYSVGWIFGDRSQELPSRGMFTRCVSGEAGMYGTNDFVDNGNGTVTDKATGRMWQQADDGTGREWGDALAYCEALTLAGHDDWRLPDIKELQSIVDYEKMELPAIDESFFKISDHRIYFWSNTTHGDFKDQAAIVAFGKALGRAPDREEFTDWHGAGAQRTAPKTGDPEDYLDQCSVNACDYPIVKNLSRCVR